MPAVYEHHHTVRIDEIDDLDHANNLSYLQWMISAALAHSAAQGWPVSRYKEMGQGWVVRAHTIKYLQSTMLDDVVVVRTWVADFKRFSSLRRYKIVREHDRALLATASTEWAFVDFTSHALARVPQEVIESFVIAPEPV